MPIKKRQSMPPTGLLEFGTTDQIQPVAMDVRQVQLHYAHPQGQLFLGDSHHWLAALQAGWSNTARKLNGDLFERLVRLLLLEVGTDCRCGVVNVPVSVDGQEVFRMNYQHDLLLFRDAALKVIGSVKTSSKDRLDKFSSLNFYRVA